MTRNFCKRDGCALGGTDVGSGAHLRAECTVVGSRTTNGQDNRTIDDADPGLYASTRWYGKGVAADGQAPHPQPGHGDRLDARAHGLR